MNGRLTICFTALPSEAERLVQDLERSRADVEALHRRLRETAEEMSRREAGAEAPDGADIAALLLERRTRRAELLEPVRAAWRREQPYRRALRAVERFEARLHQAVDAVPPEIVTDGPALVEGLAELGVRRRFWFRLARWRRRPRPLPARGALRRELVGRLDGHERMEVRYFEELAASLRAMITDWAAASGGAAGGERSARDREPTPVALAGWTDWAEETVDGMGRRLALAWSWSRAGRDPEVWPRRSRSEWSSALRALESEWNGDEALERTEDAMLELGRSLAADLSEEAASMASTLDEALRWLDAAPAEELDREAPELVARIVPSSRRYERYEAALREALSLLPDRETVILSIRRWPRRQARYGETLPRKSFWSALERQTLPPVAAMLDEVEGKHAGILRQVSEAHDVLRFASAVELDSSDRATLVAEARANARSLLESVREELVAPTESLESQLKRALVAGFTEGRLLLSRDRMGAWRHLARQGLRRGSVLAAATLAEWATRGLVTTTDVLKKMARAGLVRIGWAPAPEADTGEVSVRAYLPREFTSQATREAFPPLFERIFRLEPLEDERFLVGRDRELAALAEAHELWQSGRPVAAIVVGERGSGKTSLMNCALNGVLRGPELVRGQFASRLTTEAQLRGFLAELLGIDDPADLEATLASGRRLIVLEELERTFLRHIGHFGAVRALQRLIAQTSDTTLWVLVTNQIAYRLLDAAVGLGQTFSHRLNAAAIGREDLETAILRRQKLSGLRVRFPEPPASTGFAARVRSVAGTRPDPHRVFFDTLADESYGVFRTALTLWRQHVERIDQGVLWLRPMVPPDLSGLTRALDLQDLFTLVAVSQHGSLTIEEHSVVFQRSFSSSRAQLDELFNRELIEPDPHHEGLRIRPQALRVVRDALYRRNLL